LTLVLLGPGVFPPIVLDQRLELDEQAIVLQRIFGQIPAWFEAWEERPKNAIAERIMSFARLPLPNRVQKRVVAQGMAMLSVAELQ
jgi:hypothetical protein